MPSATPLILHTLTKARLRELIAAFDLKLAAAEGKDAHVELLATSPAAPLPELLARLSRDELKEACRVAGLDTRGREKALLASRLLGREGRENARPPEPSPPPVPADAADVADAAGAAPKPRRSRKAPAIPEPEPAPAPTPTRPSPTSAAPPAAPARRRPAAPPLRQAPAGTRLEPGQIVHVRARRYLVDEVLPPVAPRDATLCRLSCLDDDAQGQRLEVLWEKEIDARILARSSWEEVAARGFDRPELFSAFLHTIRWGCVTATDPRLFQAPYRAGIQIKDYQLEPLRKALAMPRVRLFIADDVGLGKTIEAGLILREMLMRQRIRRVVVAAPPSVVRQWQEEMDQRFGLGFVILDRDYVATCRRERGYGQNPWATHSRFIVSHALLRDEAYAAPLRDWLGTSDLPSLLILDEAHNAAPASGARYAVDSHLTRAVREIAGRFEHRLFLSATPHNGHSNSFSALLEILDPDRFCRGVPVDRALLEQVMVRRLKSDLGAVSPGDIPARRVLPEVIDGLPDDAPELALAALLQEYREARAARLARSPRGARTAAALILTTLQKRLLSSIEAFAVTLRVHRKAIERQAAAAAASPEPAEVETHDAEAEGLLLEGTSNDDDRAELAEDEVAAEEAGEVERQSRRAPPPSSAELDLLARMAAIADAARDQPDHRIRRLLAWIRAHQCPDLGAPGAAWQPVRVLVFTEYADTKRYLLQQLEAALAGSDRASERLAAFHGGMPEDAREAIKTAFNADPEKHPLRILVATDAAREGVNLQNHCADLFHFDVPWNPSRMEQRNGRIDRTLQRAKVVTCRYFVLPQRVEDRVLDVVVRKTRAIRDQLGAVSPVIQQSLHGLLQGGIDRAREADLTRDIEAVEPARGDVDQGPAGAPRRTLADLEIERELEAIRRRQQDLVTTVGELRELLDRSQRWLGFHVGAFQAALSAALELLGAPALAPVDPAAALRDPARARWALPALGSGWEATLDSLRAPRGRDQKLWEWRRSAPLRPVVFADPGSLDGEVVHLHLEHRLVQRLLGRFVAQGFVQDQLTRACVVRCEAPVPRVLILGRLALYGAHAARLHDEILAVAAPWAPPDGRAPLAPLADDAAQAALAELERGLATAHLRKVPGAVRDRLRAAAARDVAELLPVVQERARVKVADAEALLHARGDDEGRALRQVLRAQIRRIEKKLAEEPPPQLTLGLGLGDADEAGARQLAADRRYWGERLPQLQAELDRAPAAIRASYTVQAVRVEPLGLCYLWPLSA